MTGRMAAEAIAGRLAPSLKTLTPTPPRTPADASARNPRTLQHPSRHLAPCRRHREAIQKLSPRAEKSDAALVALLIAEAAAQRRESRGAHIRTDFPDTLPSDLPPEHLKSFSHRSCRMIPLLLVEQEVRRGLLEDLAAPGTSRPKLPCPPTTTPSVRWSRAIPASSPGWNSPASPSAWSIPRSTSTSKSPTPPTLPPAMSSRAIAGPARGILSAERVALNFLGPLSGIATATHGIADAIAHTKARITCTRKTTPGLRLAQKYAVRCGGGANHRFGLDDAILIKDNHIAIAGGIRPALRAAPMPGIW